MRFLHTADWHLGRTLAGIDLLEDQAHFIDHCYLPALREHRPHAVVIAGDVFDRALPPAGAVELFDRAVASTVVELGIPMLVVAGNHDGPERLAAHRSLLGAARFHVVGRLRDEPEEVILGEPGDQASFWLVPFPDCLEHQARRRRSLQEAGDGVAPSRVAIPSHAECMSEAVRQIEARMTPGRPHVLVTHAMVAGSQASSSERQVCVGTAEAVPHDLFERFTYVALGHIHRPQSIGRASVRYSGSPLAYAFDELTQAVRCGGKQMMLVDLNAGEQPTLTPIPVRPRRPLVIIRGTAEEIVAGPPAGVDPDGYVLVQRTDAGTHPTLMERVRQMYPNFVRIMFATEHGAPSTSETVPSHVGRSTEDVIEEFLRDCTPPNLTEDARAGIDLALAQVLASHRSAERSGEQA